MHAHIQYSYPNPSNMETHYLVMVLVPSRILLVAMIGAITLTKQEDTR